MELIILLSANLEKEKQHFSNNWLIPLSNNVAVAPILILQPRESATGHPCFKCLLLKVL